MKELVQAPVRLESSVVQMTEAVLVMRYTVMALLTAVTLVMNPVVVR